MPFFEVTNLLRFVVLIAILSLAAAARPPMKAIVIHSSGGPEVLKYEDAPRPEPKDDEVLIRVMAAAVNPVDVFIREGRSDQFPLIPGMDVAGVVEQVGNKVTKFKRGNSIYAYLSFDEQGGYAEFAVAKQDHAALKPESIDFEQAAAVPLAATTAWQALIDKAGLSTGQTVLIHGGSGGVGTFAVQIAKARGAKVTATASTANQDLLKQLGADVAIDYTKTKFEDIAKDVDIVFDTVGRDTLARSYPLVKKGGIVTTIVSRPDQAQLDKYGIRGSSIWSHPDGNELAEITKLIEAGKIKPVVGQVLPLTDAVKASQQAETHHTRGKIVLKIAEEPR